MKEQIREVTKMMDCPICGKKAVIIHLYDTYDRADFGFVCGCPSYKIDDGIHSLPMVVNSIVSKDDAIERWNRKAGMFE